MENLESLIQFSAKTVNNHKQQHTEDFIEMSFMCEILKCAISNIYMHLIKK